MLNAKIDGGNVERLVVTGTMTDIMSELCLEIALIYASFAKRNKGAGEFFSTNLIKALKEKVFEDEDTLELVSAAEEDDDEEEVSEEAEQEQKLEKVAEALHTLLEYLKEDDEEDDDNEGKRFRA